MATRYVNLSLGGAAAGAGSVADPFNFAFHKALIEGDSYGDDSVRQSGSSTLGASLGVIGNASAVFDGWDGSTATGYDIWRLYTGANVLDFTATPGNNLVFSRMGIDQSSYSFAPPSNTRTYTFRSSYLYHGTSIQFSSTKSYLTWNFDGCTIASPLFTIGYNGQIGHALNFDWCLFRGTVFDATANYTYTFSNCWFTKTQAEVTAGMGGSPTFTNCTFSFKPNDQLPNDITTIQASTLRYSAFFPAEYSGDFTDFDHGFASEDRQGPGAFYFGISDASGTATPESGKSPLDVTFETSPEEDVDVQWDFNDGTYSEEWQVSKRYDSAGKYEVALTWTDALGNTSTTTFTIYVYDWDYSGEGVWASYTDECLRLSLKPAKGLGWSEFGGTGWPFPEARVGPLKITDSQDKERQLVLDSVWGRVVEIGRTFGFMDLAGGYDEQNIQTEIKFPEETGEAEHYFLESLEHHAHFRPFSESDGYLDDFTVDFSLLKDGAQSDTLRTQEIPLDGDITLRPEDEAHRWQPRIVTTASGYRLVRLRDYYVVRDKIAAPGDRVMSEQDWEGELGNVLMHMGRSSNPALNFATGVDFTGDYNSTVIGPDGRDDSAVAFVGGGFTAADSMSLDGDFSIVAWVSNIGSTQTILSQASGFRVRVTVGASYQLEYRDGSGTYTSTALSWGGSGWAMLTIVRSGSTLSMYHDDTLIFSQEIVVVTNTGAGAIFPSSTGYGFDIKVIDGALEAGAIEYHHRDVTKKEGTSTCPLF